MLLYMSMVGNKKKKIEHLIRNVCLFNIRAVCFDMPKEADESLVDFRTVVMCTCATK